MNWAHQRAKQKGTHGIPKRREQNIRTGVNTICKTLNVTQIDFFNATVTTLERWFPTLDEALKNNFSKYQSAHYVFRLMMEMKGSRLSPFVNHVVKSKPKARKKTIAKKESNGSRKAVPKVTSRSIRITVDGPMEIVISDTNHGTMHYSITQIS